MIAILFKFLLLYFFFLFLLKAIKIYKTFKMIKEGMQNAQTSEFDFNRSQTQGHSQNQTLKDDDVIDAEFVRKD